MLGTWKTQHKPPRLDLRRGSVLWPRSKVRIIRGGGPWIQMARPNLKYWAGWNVLIRGNACGLNTSSFFRPFSLVFVAPRTKKQVSSENLAEGLAPTRCLGGVFGCRQCKSSSYCQPCMAAEKTPILSLKWHSPILPTSHRWRFSLDPRTNQLFFSLHQTRADEDETEFSLYITQ